MTDQQKKSVSEAAINFANRQGYYTRWDSKVGGFESGAEEVLNNPEKYKLVDSNAYIDAIKGSKSFRESLRIERIKSDRLSKENEQLLNMLKSIVDSINTDTYPLGKIASAKIEKAKLLVKEIS